MSLAEDIGTAAGIAAAGALTSDIPDTVVRLPLIVAGAFLGRYTAAILADRERDEYTERCP